MIDMADKMQPYQLYQRYSCDTDIFHSSSSVISRKGRPGKANFFDDAVDNNLIISIYKIVLCFAAPGKISDWELF